MFRVARGRRAYIIVCECPFPARCLIMEAPGIGRDEPCIDTPVPGWSMIKAGHWELGVGYRETVLRAQALVRQSNSGERIEQPVLCFGYSTEIDLAHVLPRYMRLSGGSEKLGHALRILFADCWVFREMQQGTHATTTPVVKNAHKAWKKLGLPDEEFSRWMQAVSKAARFYWATGGEARSQCLSEAPACAVPI